MRIELRDVRKRFGAMQALRGLDLVVPAGRRVALVGPNGSGKSTLIRSILGLLSCEGEVLLDGRSPFENRLESAKRLAYVPQVAPQLSATVGEVIRTTAFLRSLDEARIEAVASRLELDVAAVRTRPFRNLSGGMKQKLLIACAFAADASLLVLDEPTASLDANARDRFFALCEEIPEGTTMVLCSHRLEELRQLAEHVVALEDGKVSYEGVAREFLAGKGRLRSLVLADGEVRASHG